MKLMHKIITLESQTKCTVISGSQGPEWGAICPWDTNLGNNISVKPDLPSIEVGQFTERLDKGTPKKEFQTDNEETMHGSYII